MIPAEYHFEYPWALLLIPLVALPIAVLAWLRANQREETMILPSLSTYLNLPVKTGDSWRMTLYKLRPLLIFAVLTLLAVGIARPRVPEKEVIVHREGVDIVVVFDISTSMKAADFKPRDRFTVARETIKKFAKGRANDRIGLVIFAGTAYTQVPLTSDTDIIMNVLDSVRMGVIEDGTAIGDALATAVNRLRDSEAKSKVVVLLTDGDNNRGNIDPLEAARIAGEYGIKVHTIQVGKGGMVDYPTGGGMFYQKVKIPVNPELLKSVSGATGGKFFIATDSRALQRIFDVIDNMEKTPLPEPDFVLYRERYATFSWIAFGLVLLMTLLSATVLRRLRG